MSVRVGDTLISPLVNSGGGGGGVLTITMTPQEGSYEVFTWSGATTQQIADAFAAGTTIKLDYGSDGVYDVDQLYTFASGANINVGVAFLASYNGTVEAQLFYDGSGIQFGADFYTADQVDDLLDDKQDTLTAGTGISLSNNTLAIDTSVVATQSDLPTSNQLTAASAAYSAQYLVSNIYKNQVGTAFNMIRNNMRGGTSLESVLLEAFGGATAGAAGSIGLVPKPAAGDNGKFLKGDGTWATVSGGGASTLTITVTYSQQEEDEFTWSGATINEIKSAYNSGTEIYIPTRYMGTVKITSLSGDSQELYMTALYTGYQTCTFLLNSNGTGEVYWYELTQEQTLQDVEDTLRGLISNKQDKLTAGTGISISNNVISATGGGLTCYDFVTQFGFDPLANGLGQSVTITQAQYNAFASFVTNLDWDTSRVTYTYSNIVIGNATFSGRLTLNSYDHAVGGYETYTLYTPNGWLGVYKDGSDYSASGDLYR